MLFSEARESIFNFSFKLPAGFWLGPIVQVFLQVSNVWYPEFLFIQFHSATPKLLSKQTNSLFMFSFLLFVLSPFLT